jgi:DNA-binding CsgD family transcriptional regulator
MANRLTRAQVAEIRALAGRLSMPEIARRFDVSPGTIGNILAGRTWREPANETHLA